MNAISSVGAAMAASASGFLHSQHMRPRPFAASALRTRALDGSYPFRAHHTVAQLWAAGQ